jgi:hypothetical protein
VPESVQNQSWPAPGPLDHESLMLRRRWETDVWITAGPDFNDGTGRGGFREYVIARDWADAALIEQGRNPYA